MVAKQVWNSEFRTLICYVLLSRQSGLDDCHDDATINQSDHIIFRRRETSLEFKLREKSDVKMSTNDPKLDARLRSQTSFEGVKLSYVEWSDEFFTYLSVIDYQEFVPNLQAVIVTRTSSPRRCLSRALSQRSSMRSRTRSSKKRPPRQVLEASSSPIK